MAFKIEVLCFLACIICSYTEDELNLKLKKYDIIDSIKVHSISERSTDQITLKASRTLVDFEAFNRKFSLKLNPVGKAIFSPDFKAQVVHGNGKRDDVEIDQNSFYTGIVNDDEESEVHAYFDNDDTITASISTKKENIVVEPYWRHGKSGKHPSKESDKHGKRKKSMVVYQAEDVKWPSDLNGLNGSTTGPQFCGAMHADKEHGFKDVNFIAKDEHSHHRSKRSTKVNCRVIAVADYKFYTGIGGSDLYRTANYIVAVMQKANLIYRNTGFNSGSGLGFEIAQMIVHDSYTPVFSGAKHYNMDASWRSDSSGLLQTFSALPEEWSSFCLAHLFTHQPFDNNILGLAYIASSSTSKPGGICSPPTYLNGIEVSPNTGFSSTMYRSGGTVLTRQAELVTAHEFGHNWGSPHDDTGSSSCAPSSLIGDGKYLMYPYSVTGEDPNNDDLSSCSKNWISSVLATKQSSCFSESNANNLCGNGRIDYSNNEECDSGPLGSFNLDPCCDSQCRLKSGAICSPYNFGCCDKTCKVAARNTLCNSGEICKNSSYCDGINIRCPAAPPATRGTPCSGGMCNGGNCTPICEFNGKISCACQDTGISCRRCCKDTNNGVCSPYGTNLFLSNGQPCPKGYCQSGTCVASSPGAVEKLFNFLENISIDAIAEMFKTNMVAFIQLFSLILWIPLCIIIYCIDKRKTKKYRLEQATDCRPDRTLTMDEDRREIRRRRKFPKMVPAGSINGSHLPPVRVRGRPPSSTGSRTNRITPVSRRY